MTTSKLSCSRFFIKNKKLENDTCIPCIIGSLLLCQFDYYFFQISVVFCSFHIGSKPCSKENLPFTAPSSCNQFLVISYFPA